ncbi:MAG: hypothetical protein ACR2OA_00330 [Rubripirellula sp.]
MKNPSSCTVADSGSEPAHSAHHRFRRITQNNRFETFGGDIVSNANFAPAGPLPSVKPKMDRQTPSSWRPNPSRPLVWDGSRGDASGVTESPDDLTVATRKELSEVAI